MNKSYLEVCSPILYPKMVVIDEKGKRRIESAGIKRPNLEKHSMIVAMILTTLLLACIFLRAW